MPAIVVVSLSPLLWSAFFSLTLCLSPGEGSGYRQLPSSAPATTDPLPSSSIACGDISTVSEGHRDAQREVVGTGSCAHELELTSSLDRDLKDLLHN